jgi:mono/diheme cytochrome c family protein
MIRRGLPNLWLGVGGVPGFRSAMPGFSGTLSDEDIRDILGFIKTQ